MVFAHIILLQNIAIYKMFRYNNKNRNSFSAFAFYMYSNAIFMHVPKKRALCQYFKKEREIWFHK